MSHVWIRPIQTNREIAKQGRWAHSTQVPCRSELREGDCPCYISTPMPLTRSRGTRVGCKCRFWEGRAREQVWLPSVQVQRSHQRPRESLVYGTGESRVDNHRFPWSLHSDLRRQIFILSLRIISVYQTALESPKAVIQYYRPISPSLYIQS